MRSRPTPAEAALWYHIRAHRFGNAKFRRQTVIGAYIADFTCRAAMLVIEIDGDSHAVDPAAEERRTHFIEEMGWRVMRFTNAEVMGSVEAVLERIEVALLPLSLALSPKGERE